MISLELLLSIIGLIVVWLGFLEKRFSTFKQEIKEEVDNKLKAQDKLHAFIQASLKEDIGELKEQIKELTNKIDELLKR